jgi:hypothetical protein
MMDGLRDYRNNGMIEPDAVKVATADYRAAEDTLGEFLKDYCVIEPGAMATAAELYEVYSSEFGGKWTKTGFGKALAERFEKQKPKSGPYRDKVVYVGIRVATADSPINTGEAGTTDRDFFEENDNWDQLGPVGRTLPYDLPNSRTGFTKLVPTSPKVEFDGVGDSQKVLPSDPPKHVLRCKCGADVACAEWMGWLGGRCECGKVVKERKQ